MRDAAPGNALRAFIFVGVSVVAFGLFVSWTVGGRLIAPAPSAINDAPLDLPVEWVSIRSNSGSILSGWHVRNSPSRGVVVLVHGIRGSRLSMLSRARLLYRNGYSTVLVDLQAHGESPGERITVGYLESRDVSASLDFARQQHPGEPLGLVGVSLGGASALLAAPLNIDALVVEAAYSDVRIAVHNRVKERLGALSWLPAELLLVQFKPRIGVSPDELRPIARISAVEAPILVASGSMDLRTTMLETLAMFSAASEPKELWVLEGAGHVDLYRAEPNEYQLRVLGFLEKHLQASNPLIVSQQRHR